MNLKHNRIMQVFELENDFVRHRQKIVRMQKRNMGKQLRKAHSSQMDVINTFRRNWVKASTFKIQEKNKEINYENKLLHQSLHKQYNRSNSLQKSKINLKQTVVSRSNSSSSRISLRGSPSKDKLIKQQNQRLMNKIIAMESSLSKTKMDRQYIKTRENKKRLEVYSAKNKQRMRQSLRKMKIEPTINFPKMKPKYQTIK